MKKIIFIIALTFTFGNLVSQDTIIRRSSEIIIAKILEISPTEIRYKKYDFQDGPTYIEIKARVKKIHYANGMKEEFEEQKVVVEVKPVVPADDYIVKEAPESTKIDMWGQNNFRYKNRHMGEREIQEVLLKSKDKKIISLVGAAKDAKRAQYFGFAGIPLGIGAGVLFVSSVVGGGYSGFDETYLAGSAVCLVAAIACPVIAVTLKSKRNKCNREAVRLYNEKY